MSTYEMGENKMSKMMFSVISSQNLYGTMNTGTMKLTNITSADKEMLMERHNLSSLAGYELTKEDKKILLENHRKAFADVKKFDWGKMFVADQDLKNGSFFEITEDYVEAYPKGWSDIPQDILVVTDKTPGVVIGHPVADCPVVMTYDINNGVAAVCHCSAELIDKGFTTLGTDILRGEYGSKKEDLNVWVTACAGPEWTYDSYPKWAQDFALWEEAIVEENGMYKIDIRKAMKKQFDKTGLDMSKQIAFNLESTIKNPRYYSNSASRTKPSKNGRHFEGLIWQDPVEFRKR